MKAMICTDGSRPRMPVRGAWGRPMWAAREFPGGFYFHERIIRLSIDNLMGLAHTGASL